MAVKAFVVAECFNVLFGNNADLSLCTMALLISIFRIESFLLAPRIILLVFCSKT